MTDLILRARRAAGYLGDTITADLLLELARELERHDQTALLEQLGIAEGSRDAWRSRCERCEKRLEQMEAELAEERRPKSLYEMSAVAGKVLER